MQTQKITRPTRLEVNLDNFQYNVEQIKKKLQPGTQIMPVIKANAYGTYINTRIDLLDQFPIVAVAIVDEGRNLRKLGYKKEILVLNQPAIEEIEEIQENNLVIGLSSKEFLEELEKRKLPIRVHLEIETGMGRTGISIEELEEIEKKLLTMPFVKVEGIYTHLSSADNDKDYTKKQLGIFQKAVDQIKAYFPNISYIHASASNGLINFPEGQYNLVRAGMILYGYESGEKIKEKISLKPVCTLKSKVTFLKTVKEGTSISYGRKFITKKETKIATIPIGYADGLKRSLSNQGEVLIRGKKVPIIGAVCMDSFMADVTALEEVKVGDEVLIWDNEKITIEDLANQCKTINYEILSTISQRVPRQFIELKNKK